MNIYVLVVLVVVLVFGMISLCEGKCGKIKISDLVFFCVSYNCFILLFLIGIYILVKIEFYIYVIFFLSI